jgi:hypothetical protein
MKTVFYILLLITLAAFAGLIPSDSVSALSLSFPPAYDAKVIPDGKGSAFVAFADDALYVQHLDPSGRPTWNKPVNTNQKPLVFSITIDENGSAIVVWGAHDLGSLSSNNKIFEEIRAQKIDTAGNILWPVPGILVSRSERKSDNRSLKELSVLSDKEGGAILVWKAVGDNLEIVAQKIDANGNISWDNEGKIITQHAFLNPGTVCVSDGAGGAIITWAEFQNSGKNIIAQRLDRAGNLLWGDKGKLLGEYITGYQVVTDGEGGAIAVFETTWNLSAINISSYGQVKWGGVDYNILTGGNKVSAPQVITDGHGGIFLIWAEVYALNSPKLYAQRLDNTGTPVWEKPSTIAKVQGFQFKPQLIPDNSGGFIIAWKNYDPNNSYVFMQRVDVAGKTLWGKNGRNITRLFRPEKEFSICSSGSGTILVTEQGYGAERGLYIYGIDDYGITKHARTSFYPEGLARVTHDFQGIGDYYSYPSFWKLFAPIGIVLVGGAVLLAFFEPRKLWSKIYNRKKNNVKEDILN